MTSKNPLGADNQQERLEKIGWIVGFTDGEGCFSVSIFKNRTSKIGWQVMPEFVLTQGKSSLNALEETQSFFGCGKIFINKRYDNHHKHLYRFCVRNRHDLNQIIVPFFQQHQLRTRKRQNFERFCQVLSLMDQKEHLNRTGLYKIAKLVGKQLSQESSHTTRQGHFTVEKKI